MSKRFSKFIRPETARPGVITDRDLDILTIILRYRFCGVSELVRLAGGNEDVARRRLRFLWERGLVSYFVFPGIRSHSEFYYYLDNREALDLLSLRRGFVIRPEMLLELKSNKDKDYANAAIRGQHMQLGFLQHSLMISRLHFMLEQACQGSGGRVELGSFAQGAALAGHKVDVPRVISSRSGNDYFWQETDETIRLPVEPDALFSLRFPERAVDQQLMHFCYEADRGSMVMTDMLRKFRGYYEFIKRQGKHKQAFGVHPIRAVLIETTDEDRARRLLELVNHPLVAGPGRRAGLFWCTISPLFVESARPTDSARPASFRRYLDEPEVVFQPIWALPDRSLHALSDAENSPARLAAAV